MHVIVRLGNGEFYTTPAFAIYRDTTTRDRHGRLLDDWHNVFYVVLNQEKNALVRQYEFRKGRQLDKQVLIIDSDRKNWNVDEDGFGEVKGYTQEELLSMIESGAVPRDFLEADASYRFEEYKEIRTKKDIEDLLWLSGDFHDAFIIEYQEEDGCLRVLFGSEWVGKIEMWFSGDISYNIDYRAPDGDVPWWLDSTMLIKDGFIYLLDDGDLCAEDINKGYCYFKARQVKYRIIPK